MTTMNKDIVEDIVEYKDIKEDVNIFEDKDIVEAVDILSVALKKENVKITTDQIYADLARFTTNNSSKDIKEAINTIVRDMHKTLEDFYQYSSLSRRVIALYFLLTLLKKEYIKGYSDCSANAHSIKAAHAHSIRVFMNSIVKHVIIYDVFKGFGLLKGARTK